MPVNPVPSTTHPELHDIPTVLETLRETDPGEEGVLSVYLPTPLAPVAGRTFLISFREACKTLRESLSEAARDNFDAAAARADSHLAEAFVPREPGLALFVSPAPDYFFAVPLPGEPTEELVWASHPALAPLEALLDDYERVAVALVDRSGARLFTVYLGAIESRRELESNVPGQHAKGRWGGMARMNYARQHESEPGRGFGRGPRGGGMAAARYARHHQDAVLEHVRNVARELMALLRAWPYDRLLLAGAAETVTMLRDELPRPLRARLAGELSLPANASDATVLQATTEAALELERQAEVELVDELLAASGTSRAALGFDATLAALSEHRVYHLFLADTFAGLGGECQSCRRLVAGPGPCPACGGATTPMAELRERIVERALEQGARIEIVSGEAAARLMAHGGLGAWTRY